MIPAPSFLQPQPSMNTRIPSDCGVQRYGEFPSPQIFRRYKINKILNWVILSDLIFGRRHQWQRSTPARCFCFGKRKIFLFGERKIFCSGKKVFRGYLWGDHPLPPGSASLLPNRVLTGSWQGFNRGLTGLRTSQTPVEPLFSPSSACFWANRVLTRIDPAIDIHSGDSFTDFLVQGR